MSELKEICLFETDIDVVATAKKALKMAQDKKNFLLEVDEEEELLFVDESCVSRTCCRCDGQSQAILTRLQGIHIIENFIKDYDEGEAESDE